MPTDPSCTGPSPSHQLTMPAQQRRRRDPKGHPTTPGKEAPKYGENGPIGWLVSDSAHLPTQHFDFVAQHEDLDVLVLVAPPPQYSELEMPAEQSVPQRTRHATRLCEH